MMNCLTKPMPSPTLAKRFYEIGVPYEMVELICFGDDKPTKVFADAFMKRGHVLIVYDYRAAIVPPRLTLKKGLDYLKEIHHA